VEFLPSFPAGTLFTKVYMNGQDAKVASFTSPQYTSLISKFNFTNPIMLEIEFDKGISVLPVIAYPKPGDSAAGLRIISSGLKGNQYIIELEGKPGSTGSVKVYINNQELEKIENGKILGKKGNIVDIEVTFEAGKESYLNKSVIIFLK
jgi:hypothetical protein